MQLSLLSYGIKTDLLSGFWKRAVIYFAYFTCVLLGSTVAYLVAKRLSLPIRKLATVMINTRNQTPEPYIDDT